MRNPQLLTTAQAADELGLSPNTLQKWRWKRHYDLPFTRVGKKVYYDKNELQLFCAKRTQRNVVAVCELFD